MRDNSSYPLFGEVIVFVYHEADINQSFILLTSIFYKAQMRAKYAAMVFMWNNHDGNMAPLCRKSADQAIVVHIRKHFLSLLSTPATLEVS